MVVMVKEMELVMEMGVVGEMLAVEMVVDVVMEEMGVRNTEI